MIGQAADPADAIGAAVLWAQSALLGTVASAVAVIAIAATGLMMLSGRIDVRRGLRTVLGCFLIFGAPSISAAFMALGSGTGVAPPPPPMPEPAPVLTPPPAKPAYDPYAGASVPSR